MRTRLIKIGEAAKILGSSPAQLRKWALTGELLPARKTQGGTRYYDANTLLNGHSNPNITLCYARVSRHDQKADLERQHIMLETYCAAKFSARPYGKRRHKNKKRMDALSDVVGS